MHDSQTPFSDIMHSLMVKTTQALVEGVQNCVLGYTQSDEISLLLRDWDTFETQQWFGGSHQKMVSVSASIATAAFNFHAPTLGFEQMSFADMAQFDSRAYNLPKEEVTNYFIWRQQDASRNSVQMLGHHHFSQKQMHGKNNSEVQDMLMLEKNINWNDIPTWMKRGTCVTPSGVDEEIPIFTQERWYVEHHTKTVIQQEQDAAAEAWRSLTGSAPA
jgi:tRNA(His) 5'-end guanylyltransferase